MGPTRHADESPLAEGDETPPHTPAEPGERLSLVRLAAALGVAGLIAGGVVLGISQRSTESKTLDTSWSVPYVDVTLTPTYQFQNPQSNPARDIALAFIVADPDDECTPSWGGAYTIEEAAQDLELDRRIIQLRAAGGDVMVSFGGQANSELAFACSDVAALTDAYRTVVEHYDLHAIDLDIENADLADMPSIERRSEAIAAVQAERVAGGDELAVWITLPVATSGLTADGVELVRATIEGGVDVSGVNVMTMNFGSAEDPTDDMFAATKQALEASVQQVADIFDSQGITLSSTQRWARLGATPMIGQNDIAGEVFTLDDAAALAEFALSKGLGRVSTWSLNRDAPCSPSFADVRVLSNTCSGVSQEALDFAIVFIALPGRAASLPAGTALTVKNQQQVVDDPTTSPYPIWRPDAQYQGGYKVVRGGLVYEAKWYNQGFEPSMVTASPWDNPWSLIGPVGPDDVPFAPTPLAPGTHPEWTPVPLYTTGDKVLFDGLPYEARWPNQAEPPSTLFPVGPDSAWNPLFTLRGQPVAP